MTSQREPLKVAAYAADPWESACPVLRLTGPCVAAGMRLTRGSHWEGNTLRVDATAVDGADVVVIQRDFPRFWEDYRNVMTRARARGLPVIYDLDDLLFDLPEGHPDAGHYRDARMAIMGAVLEAEAVTGSTPALCEALRVYHDAVYLLPNLLNDGLWQWDGATPQPSGEPVVIGYMGGGTHEADVALVGPALRQVAERYGDGVAIRFMGRTGPPAEIAGLPNVTWERVAFLDYAEFANWFGKQRLDIGLAPLRNTPFNRSKSGIKFLEYSAVGAASVCSRVLGYVDMVGEDEALLVRPDEWAAALDRLTADAALRQRLARAARAGVARRWLLSQHAGAWAELYERVRTAPRGRGQSGSELAAALRRMLAWQQESQSQLAELDEYQAQVRRQEKALAWQDAELRQMRGSITWRATEPVRQVYARWQRWQGRKGEAERSAPVGASAGETPVTPEPAPLVDYADDSFFWTMERYASTPALAATPLTDVVVCVGPHTALAERCVEALRRHTDPSSYRLRLVVHREDAARLPEGLTAGAEVIPHDMAQFNFARANNLALARSDGDVVLLNDDTEVTPGWLARLREDSRGYALTGARTCRLCSGNPDQWDEGGARLTWYPINMFCAYIPQRVRAVVGALDEEFVYYGGEDVDYSCRSLQHGFPLVVSSAFVQHATSRSFGGQKARLISESDKVLLERYRLRAPYHMAALKPLASVIMATHNRAGLLANAARSILAGLYPEIELIIVDDASSDETPEIVARLQETDRRVISIRLAQSAGAVGARARGIAAARGQFIAFMDDDDTAWPNRILAPLQYLMLHPELDAVYCAFDVVSELGRVRGVTQPLDLEAYLERRFDIGSGVLLLRRQAIEDVPFMARYERAIDYDWVFRMVRRGYRLEYCPAVVLDYNRAGPAEAHLSGNSAAIQAHAEIYEREQLLRDFRRK